MEKYLVGVDLGGTNMRAGIITADGKVLLKEGVPTLGETRTGEEILSAMAGLIRKVMADQGVDASDVIGAGIGIPGPLDPKIGGAHPPNLKQLSGLRITEILEKLTGLKVILENDANAAAWGEFWIGAGQGCQSMIQATLGTGIGGGIIINGSLIRGIDHTTGELGHVVVCDGGRPCACGSNGCIEAYSSANSLVRRFNEAVTSGRETSLDGEVTCATIFKAAKAGDTLAGEMVEETGRLLGVLCASMANLLNPERFVFSGGMIRDWDYFAPFIKDECEKRSFPIPFKRMQILPAALGDDAGLIGAAGCALTKFEISL